MKRRQVLKGVLATGVVAGVGAAVLLRGARPDLTVDAALRRIDALSGVRLAHRGSWNAFQVFSHCAQSVEYSLSGYPQSKSALFQNTAGTAAFGLFAARGKMTHGLAEPIPGAPLLPAQDEHRAGLDRLRAAFVQFRDWSGPLAPHFAYGTLDRRQYEQAHVMHFFNHLDELNEQA